MARIPTIRAGREVEAVFKTGKRAGTRLVTVLGLPNEQRREPQGRVVFVAGKKVGSAVARNRAKRRLRAACARIGGPWRGWDVAIVARQQTAGAPAVELDRDLREAVRRTMGR